nr:root allergen protein-like [Tanacetum cinerariifolium]
MPNVVPDSRSIYKLQSDEGVCPNRRDHSVISYGDAVPYTSAKYKIDAIDVNNFSATYSVIEGDALLGTPSTHHFKIVPSANGGAVFKDIVVLKRNAKPTEETLNQFKELFKNTFKAHEAYAIAHPEVYNWLRHEPVQQWRSNSWDKPIQNRMQKVFEKGYLRRESAANMLPRSSQRKLLSRESKEMLMRKVKEIEAYNASNVRAAIKEKENGKATTRKEKRARCH